MDQEYGTNLKWLQQLFRINRNPAHSVADHYSFQIFAISLTVSVTPESVQGVLESAGIAVLSCSPPESLRRSLDQFSLATAVLRRGVDREKPSD